VNNDNENLYASWLSTISDITSYSEDEESFNVFEGKEKYSLGPYAVCIPLLVQSCSVRQSNHFYCDFYVYLFYEIYVK
jgi:hypothetical protein